MPRWSIDVPDKVEDAVIEAVCGSYGYTEGDRKAFARRMLREHLQRVAVGFAMHRDPAGETARVIEKAFE